MTVRIILLVIGMALVLTACGLFDEEGCCEVRTDHSTGPSFSCREVWGGGTAHTADTCARRGDARVFHPNRSCEALGYTRPNAANPDILYYGEEGYAQSPHGDPSLGSGPAGGDGGSLDLDTQCAIENVWSGAADDQFAYHCAVACAYRAEGHVAEAEATCDILRTADDEHGFATVQSCSACN